MRALLISPNDALRSGFMEAVTPFRRIALSKALDVYPPADALNRIVRAWAPEVVFLDIEDPGAAEVVSRQLESEFPTIQRVALHRSQEPAVFRRVLQLQMRELLTPPFEHDELSRVFGQLEKHFERHPAIIGSTDRFFAFMPAKAGVGASTIAANVTWAFSKSAGAKVLLADFDISSGVTGFMFDTQHDYCLSDAAMRSHELDDQSWKNIVKRVDDVDLLLSGAPRLGEPIPSLQVSHLIEFARRNYGVVNADLPDTLDETTVAVLRDANRIFLVTTPELTALRVARLKALLLRKLDLENKVSLVVNRVSRNMELTTEEIEETVGLPVVISFPCAYADVKKAIRAGQPAAKLAATAQQFVDILLEKSQREKRPRFIERFALIPLRYEFR
jgi:Flp pilus assembly CpaE family ATPase